MYGQGTERVPGKRLILRGSHRGVHVRHSLPPCALLLLLLLPSPACTFDDTVAYLDTACESRADCESSPCVDGTCAPPAPVCRPGALQFCSVPFSAPFAVCTCEGYVGNQALTVYEGSFGSNGPVNGAPPITIDGDLLVASVEGFLASGVGPVDVGGSLRSAGPVRAGGPVKVGGNLEAAGNVSMQSLHVAGTLRQPGGSLLEVTEGQSVGATATSDVAVPAPCSCDDGLPTAISAAIRNGRANNDNRAILLDAFTLDGFEGDTHLALPCGTFHVARIAGSGALSLSVTGTTTLLVDGEVALDRDFTVDVTEGGSLTLVVEGDFRVAGAATLGNDARPGRVDVLVGGGGTVSMGGPATIAGALVAPRGELVNAANLSLPGGALSARRIAAGGELTVRYDARFGSVPDACR